MCIKDTVFLQSIPQSCFVVAAETNMPSINSIYYYGDDNSDSEDDDDNNDNNDNDNNNNNDLPTPRSIDSVFSQYERRGPIIDIGDMLNVHGANDAFLLFSLESLEIDVDLDTFSALRDGVHLMSPFEEMMQREEDDAQRLMEERRDALIEHAIDAYTRVRQPSGGDGSGGSSNNNSAAEEEEDYRVWMEIMGEEFHQRAAEEQNNGEEVQLTRLALENEDVCCICLENFPNVVFEGGCQKTTSPGVCCYPCTRIMVLDRGMMKCPHCRADITDFRVVVDVDAEDEDADADAAEDVLLVG